MCLSLFSASSHVLDSAELVHDLAMLILFDNGLAVLIWLFVVAAHASSVQNPVVFGVVEWESSDTGSMALMASARLCKTLIAFLKSVQAFHVIIRSILSCRRGFLVGFSLLL